MLACAEFWHEDIEGCLSYVAPLDSSDPCSPTASQTIRSAAKENQKSVGSQYNAKATYSTMVSRLSAQTFSQKSVYLKLRFAPVSSVERLAFCHGLN